MVTDARRVPCSCVVCVTRDGWYCVCNAVGVMSYVVASVARPLQATGDARLCVMLPRCRVLDGVRRTACGVGRAFTRERA